MGIFSKIINHTKYTKYRKIRDNAYREVKKHLKDEDSTVYRYWMNVYLIYSKKCLELASK